MGKIRSGLLLQYLVFRLSSNLIVNVIVGMILLEYNLDPNLNYKTEEDTYT